MHAVVLEYPQMTWDLPVLFEFLWTSCEHFQVCFGLLLRISVHTPLRLPLRLPGLVRGMTSPVQQVDIAIFSIEVDGVSDCFSSWVVHGPAGLPPGIPDVLNSQKFPPFVTHEKSTLATIIGCISLIPLASFSGSQECQVSIVKIWGIFLDLPWGKSKRIFVIFPFQFNVIEHWHEYYSITEFFRCDVLSL